MFSGFFHELKSQIVEAGRVMRTREFWIYLGVIALFGLVAAAAFRLATAFDPLTRGQMRLDFTCRTGQGQLATVIIGCFVFGLASVFALGEVINWVESARTSKLPGREHYPLESIWRPVLVVIATLLLGAGLYISLLVWCT